MRRIRIMGLCLVAVFAFSALITSAAQAVETEEGRAEYGTCAKAAKAGKKYTGKYEDKNCTEENAKEEGKYTWVPTPEGSHIELTWKGKGAVLKSGAGEIKCKAIGGKTVIGDVIHTTDLLTATGCTLNLTKGACTSEKQKKGVVKLNLLDDWIGTLIYIPPPPPPQVWVHFESSEHEPWLAEFTCEPGVLFRVKGDIAGLDTGNVDVMSTKSTETFAEGASYQNLETEYNEGAGWETVPSEFISVADIKGPKIEIKPCGYQPPIHYPPCTE